MRIRRRVIVNLTNGLTIGATPTATPSRIEDSSAQGAKLGRHPWSTPERLIARPAVGLPGTT